MVNECVECLRSMAQRRLACKIACVALGIVRSQDDASPVHGGAGKGVDAQLSSTSGARVAKGTLWFGTPPGHSEGWKRSSRPPADESTIGRSAIRRAAGSEVARSHRHRRSTRFRIVLAAAQVQLENDWQFPSGRIGGTHGWYTRN